MLKIAKEFMDITHKVDLPDQVVSRLQKGLNFLDIPSGKVPELLDAGIVLMKAATTLLKMLLWLMPIAVAGFLLSQFL
jgi:hypothetical protein